MYLDLPEICNLARLNRASRGASEADFIWELKLPTNYRYIMEKVFDEETMLKLGKKDVYARLCRPISFDNATKEYLFISVSMCLGFFIMFASCHYLMPPTTTKYLGMLLPNSY